MPDRPVYYNIEDLIDRYPDCHYYVVWGKRSNGKTYGALTYALKNFFEKGGEQFAYIRRWATDIIPKNLTDLFKGHEANGVIEKMSDGKFNGIQLSRGRFRFTQYDKDADKTVLSDVVVGYVFDINSMEHNKGVSYPYVTTVIFDEFLTNKMYLPNEFSLFMNVVSTLVRGRSNVKILMLGNSVNQYCPYFDEMGLTHANKMKPGTTDVYRYGNSDLQVAVEYTAPNTGSKESEVYFAFDNPRLKMITTGDWEIGIYPRLERGYPRAGILRDFYIDFNHRILHGQAVIIDGEPYINIMPTKKMVEDLEDVKDDTVYSTRWRTKHNWKVGIERQPDTLSRLICRSIASNSIYFATNEVGDTFRNYILWARNAAIV